MADLLDDLPENFVFSPLDEGQQYMSNLNIIVDVLKLMHAGYNVQIQSGVDAATALEASKQALLENQEASTTHLPLQSGQANKILLSKGSGGDAFWGGEWEIKTANFSLIQLEHKIALATSTAIDVTLVTPEKVGMHVLLHNSLQSTKTVTLLNTYTFIGRYESWVSGENIELSPGDTLQAFCTDITTDAEVWELF
ncbi:MAG: hypothetical protein HRT38_02700 [Alteromonadaceae bacterium]|nr:hypothetical protein [Alteromonadaceae bacterium]